MVRQSRLALWFVGLAVALAGPAPAARAQIVFDFDTSHDGGFFTTAPTAALAMNALQTAGNMLASRLGDTLTAITPGGGNTWTTNAFDPSNPNGPSIAVTDLSIPQNHIHVYVGGAALGGGGELGLGGPGGFGSSGFGNWNDTVAARGQTHALDPTPTDFGPWGGSVSFSNTATWNFSTLTGPLPGQNDFLSVALHELGHLLGFGTADSFAALATAGHTFTGPSSTALNGGVNPPLDSQNAHWAPGFSYLGQ
ncbi:MAG TPA: hypothetical protein VGF55_20480, partial [Gemmataceae bacterium]